MNGTRWRGFLAVLLLLAGACGSGAIAPEWKRLDPRPAAHEFTLPQLDGPPVTLSAFRGRVVLMEFWATWCGPCRYSTPSLDAIFKAYRGRGVSVLLINVGESPEQVRAWAKRRFTAPILLDRDGQVVNEYGVSGIPRLFIVDREGRIVYDHGGYRGGLEQNLRLILKELLTEGGATSNA